MNYPFNTGDLLCCGQTAHNYLENNVKVPWDDLVYMFGEIMYGGHIVEDWDRRLANAYLFKYFNEALLEGIEYFPGFVAPSNTSSHKQVTEYLMDMPGETPLAFGLHPNAEIGFKLREGDAFCNSLILMQPQDSAGEGGASEEEKARTVLEDIVERLPETYDMEDIRGCVLLEYFNIMQIYILLDICGHGEEFGAHHAIMPFSDVVHTMNSFLLLRFGH